MFPEGVLELKKDAHSEIALVFFSKATELYPNYANAWYNRGVALERACRLAEALTSYEMAAASDGRHSLSRERSALLVDPRFSAEWWRLALLHGRRGNRREALACVELVLKREPQHGEALILLKRLKQG